MLIEIYEGNFIMTDIAELKNYFIKVQKAVHSADLSIFGICLVKSSRIDDLLCCILALLPDSFKATMKKRISLDEYPSVSCYNRLSKIIKKPFILSSDYYIFNKNEVATLLMTITKNIERDIKKIEEE